MKETRTNKGITLIALIITIIVLLILALVSIKLVINSGIVTSANTSKEDQIIAQEKEQIQLAYSEYQMQKYQESNPTLTVPEATANGDEILGWIITFEKTGHQYTLNSDGTIDNGVANRWDGETIEVPEISEFTWNIYNCAQFKFFADFVNNGNILTEEQKILVAEKGYNEDEITITEETQVNLMDNLDLGARANDEGEKLVGKEWNPIGTTSALKFIGTFEGNNHYVTGVYVNIDGNCGGIFGNSNTIKNLTIKNSYIKVSNCSGGIVGALRTGTIENCHNINTTVITTGYTNGGLVGQFTGTEIVNCSNSGTIKCNGKSASGYSQTGGIVGVAKSSSLTISNCCNTGNVTGEGNSVGGIIGEGLSSGVIEECVNEGTIVGEGKYIGGIIGLTYASVSNCTNTATVNGAGGVIGGIVGQAQRDTIVSNCSNMGEITNNGNYTGGIVGATTNDSTVKVEKCYNAGNINGQKYTGGIVGLLSRTSENTVINCYNKGIIQGTTYVGAIIGWKNNTTVNNLYYLNTVGIGAINGVDDEANKVMSTTEDIKTFEEFLTWIEQQ